MTDHKKQVIELLRSFETGDPKPLSHINPDRYLQHNLNLGDGLAALEARLKSRPKGSVKANTVRAFEDGELVFTHTEFNFSGNSRTAFDIFRFEDGKIVEHWDNLQETAAKPSPSGHTMTDGPTAASDLDKTETNKALMRAYMDDLLQGRRDRFPGYFDGNTYIQHNPWVADGLTGLVAGLQALAAQGSVVKYDKAYKVLGEGNFVLLVSEGTFGDRPPRFTTCTESRTGRSPSIGTPWKPSRRAPIGRIRTGSFDLPQRTFMAADDFKTLLATLDMRGA